MSWFNIWVLFLNLKSWILTFAYFNCLIFFNFYILLVRCLHKIIFHHIRIRRNRWLGDQWHTWSLRGCHNFFNFKFNRSLFLLKIRWVTIRVLIHFPLSLWLCLVNWSLNIFLNIHTRVRFLLLQNAFDFWIHRLSICLGLLINHFPLFAPANEENKIIFLILKFDLRRLLKLLKLLINQFNYVFFIILLHVQSCKLLLNFQFLCLFQKCR